MPAQESRLPFTVFVVSLFVVGAGLVAYFGLPMVMGGKRHAKVYVVPDLPGMVGHSEWLRAKDSPATEPIQVAQAAAPLRAEPPPAAPKRPVLSAEKAPAAPAAVAAAPKPAVAPISPPAPAMAKPETDARDEEPAPRIETASAPHVARSGEVTPPYQLEITATARQVWIWISVDGGPQRAVSLERGESAAFQAENGYVLTVDDAGGVEATLNGKPLPSFGPPARAKRDVVIPSEEWAPVG